MRGCAMSDPLDLFNQVLANFHNDKKWDQAKFSRIKTISNTKVGSVGQTFIEKLCAELEFQCLFPVNEKNERLTQSPWDIQINGVKLELKTATEDVGGNFQFNHVRYHRKYDGLLCLGVSPDNLYFMIWSKADVATGKAGNLVTMEKAANASFKLTKKANSLYPIANFEQEISKFVRAYNSISNS